MRAARLLRSAARSLAVHRLRTGLSALGIVFGTLALLAMLSVAEGAKRATLAQIEELGTSNLIVRRAELSEERALAAAEHASGGLSTDDLDLLRAALPEIVSLSPLCEVEATLSDAQEVDSPSVLAVTRTYFESKGCELAAGRTLVDRDVVERALVCVLGADVARTLGVNGRLGARLRLGDTAFEVVGLLARRERRGGGAAIATRDLNRSVFIPLGSHRALIEVAESAALDELALGFADGPSARDQAARVERLLERAHSGVRDFELVVPHELLRQAFRAQRTFNLLLAAVATISLLVGGIGIMNILLASVSERTREIGIRRAVGASRADVLAQFLAEATLLCGGGALFGVLGGVLAARAIANLAGWSTVITPWAVLLALAMALGVGLVAGLHPALRAARLDPIEALRHP